MRVDKYLKVARVIKRRSQAKLLADYDKIKVNGKQCKPSTHVAPNDIVEVTFGEHQLTIRVIQLITNPKKAEAELMYEIINQS